MKIFRSFLILYCCLIANIHAAGEPLYVGTESFSPPFVMQGANKEIFGYDIDMMNTLCKFMDRTCVFKIMRFDQLIPALVQKEIEVAVSSITITADRAKLINFSTPYFLSYSRFLSLKSEKPVAFTLDLLNSKKIGIETGTIFAEQISQMGIKSPQIKVYERVEKLLEAVNAGEVDFILVDNPTATYWAANSNTLVTVGPPLNYGFGLGIAIQPNNPGLVNAINASLLQYENSIAYKQNYDRYLAEF
ncbi:MAG: transporter substrate-binding domain-containing protein [Legionella sp.]|jgi:polar amino acid transport system substrate-binding protein